ncbi:MAG TPA: hypothetical protein VE913_19180 [Longimicrobium sp.]|nr:hypothetical protein [Longimicrobium sp.]
MSAQPGEPTPNAFVFPPFAPPVFRPAAESRAPAEAPPAARDEPLDFGIEVPLPAHDLGDADDGSAPAAPVFDAGDDASMPWDAAPLEDVPAPAMFADNAGPADAAPFASEAVPFAEPYVDPFIGSDAAPFTESDPLPAPFAEAEAAPWAELESAAYVEAEPAPSAETEALFAEPAATSATAEDLPWLELPNGAPRAEPAVASTAEFDIGDLAPAEPPHAERAVAPADDEMPWLDTATIRSDEPSASDAPVEAAAYEAPQPYDEPLPEYASTLGDDAAPYADAPAAAADPQPVAAPMVPDGAFAEVASRLEGIARALRDDPSAFFASAGSDPLGLLVTGFVLGYGQRPRE